MSNFSRFNSFQREAVGGMPAVMMREVASANGMPGTITTTDPKAAEYQGTATGSFADRIVSVRSPHAALTISAVYRAVGLIARTEGQFQVQYQRLNSEGGNFIPVLGNPNSKYANNGQRLNYLLQVRPNPMMTASAFMQGLVISKLQNGNGIAYIERGGDGEPRALWLCTGAQYNELTGHYLLQYYTRKGIVQRTDVPAEDVIHIPNTYKYDNGWGIPTIRFAIDTLSLIKTETNQAMETAAKGGRVKLIIGEEKPSQGAGTFAFGMLNKDQIDAYARELNTKMYQQDVVGIRGLSALHNISMSAQDQQMIEVLGMGINDVCRFYGCQRPLLMEDTNSHYSTYQNARMEFLQWTVQPDITEIEQEFNSKLLTEYDFGQRRYHLCEQPIMRLDKEAQAKVDQIMLQTGAATVNEVRQQYDRPAVENGDEPMASANLMTLKALIAKSDGATELKPGSYTVQEPTKEGEEK